RCSPPRLSSDLQPLDCLAPVTWRLADGRPAASKPLLRADTTVPAPWSRNASVVSALHAVLGAAAASTPALFRHSSVVSALRRGLGVGNCAAVEPATSKPTLRADTTWPASWARDDRVVSALQRGLGKETWSRRWKLPAGRTCDVETTPACRHHCACTVGSERQRSFGAARGFKHT